MCGKQCITPLQLSILLGSALKFSSNIYSYYVLEHKISLEVLCLIILMFCYFSDAMWEMNMKAQETMEAGLYPERPGEQDCNYYIRSGFCKFGMTCKFNHPVNRKLVI